MASVRQQLNILKRIESERSKLNREKAAENRRVDERYKPKFADLDKQAEVAKQRLAACNPYKVGDQFRRIEADGLLSEEAYQVTNVINHYKFMARVITTKGQLGRGYSTYWLRKDGWREADKIRKIKRVPLK